MERATGFEPATASLEGWNSTTELRPQLDLNPIYRETFASTAHLVVSTRSRPFQSIMVGRQGFEPWKPMAADLQSAPVDRLGTCPFNE